MEYIIHLTEKCNLNCTYCYEKKKNTDISFENIKNLIDYEINKKSKYSIIVFYGGEPLLKKDLIKSTIDYVNFKNSKTIFYYGITTNGTLLDSEFIEYIKNNNFIQVSYSIDGEKEIHDKNRIFKNGNGTFDTVIENSKKLIKEFSPVISMSVLTKENLKYLSKNVEFLINFGFDYINLMFDYYQNWNDDDLIIFKEQLNLIANLYLDKLIENYKLSIPMLDSKIKGYINKYYDCNKECKMGMKTIYVGTDGNFYPCVQFVNNENFIIGNCKEGINFKARSKLIKNSGRENKICKKCLIKKRCKHTCACKNYQLTGNINELSPFVCEVERIIIEIADKMSNKLFELNREIFEKKYYN